MSVYGLVELPIIDGAVTPGRDDEHYETGKQVKAPFQHIELEICTACDLDCHACDRFSDIINSPNMTVRQVELFVRESLDLKWKWERIRILGGEPTIHPQFREMCQLVMDYRRWYPKCFIQVLSNGHGKLEHHRDWLIDHGIDPHVEGPKSKGVTPGWFWNSRLTPLDENPSVGELPPCGIFGPRGCGIGLTRAGYFLDGAGASVAKVAGLDVGVMHLKDVTWEAMLEQAKVLCRICGHWNADSGPRRTRLVSETGKITGAFWTAAIARYNRGETPKLRVYGDA